MPDTTYEVGDVFDLDAVEDGDCPALYVRTEIPVPAQCTLDKGHEPPHVAAGLDVEGEAIVVAVWDDEVEVWE